MEHRKQSKKNYQYNQEEYLVGQIKANKFKEEEYPARKNLILKNQRIKMIIRVMMKIMKQLMKIKLKK